MNLKEMQKEVDDWIKQYPIGYFPPLSIMAQIAEETGELAREVNDRYGGRVKKSGEDTKDIGAEICDIIFALICLANSHHISLEEAWEKTISARTKRDENRYEK